MGKVGVGLLGLILGLVIGIFVAMSIGMGALLGVGAGTGLATGICAVVHAAQQEGLLTADQVNQVLARAARDLSGSADSSDVSELAGSAASCDALIARFQSKTGSQ
ncbi:MAG: hypothetical protein KDA73_04975 [Rhodobacteraceae bacterium]|nr:hypothetical protein [Paracoccaceae bacterium]